MNSFIVISDESWNQVREDVAAAKRIVDRRYQDLRLFSTNDAVSAPANPASAPVQHDRSETCSTSR